MKKVRNQNGTSLAESPSSAESIGDRSDPLTIALFLGVPSLWKYGIITHLRESSVVYGGAKLECTPPCRIPCCTDAACGSGKWYFTLRREDDLESSGSIEAKAIMFSVGASGFASEKAVVRMVKPHCLFFPPCSAARRGVRLVASAHGDFKSLVRNPALNTVLGGTVSVTVGDEMAKATGGQKVRYPILH